MTYTTSHLAISALLLTIIVPKSIKTDLNDKKWVWLIISIGAILPDFDLFIPGAHRTWSHSIFIPLFILLIINTVLLFDISHRYFIRNLNLFVLMWLSHLFFDMTFGPITLFWPFDTRLIDISMGLKLDVATNPITVLGFFFSSKFIDPRIGSQVFFTNWTSQQRISYFGSSIVNFSITDFVLHAVLFIWYLSYIAIPGGIQIIKMIAEKYNFKKMDMRSFHKYDNFLKSQKLVQNILKRYKVILIILGLISVSYFAGPYQGKLQIINNSSTHQVYILSDNLLLSSYIVYNPISNSNLTVTIQVPKSSINYTGFYGFGSLDEIKYQSNYINSLMNKFGNGNLTREELYKDYRNFILLNTTKSIQTFLYEVNSTSGYNKVISNPSNLTLFYGILNWNDSYYFIRDFNINTTWKIDTSNKYNIQLDMIIVEFILLIILIIIPEKIINVK